MYVSAMFLNSSIASIMALRLQLCRRNFKYPQVGSNKVNRYAITSSLFHLEGSNCLTSVVKTVAITSSESKYVVHNQAFPGIVIGWGCCEVGWRKGTNCYTAQTSAPGVKTLLAKPNSASMTPAGKEGSYGLCGSD